MVEMADRIDPLTSLAGARALSAGTAASSKVKEEFLAIFYKELLKQAFKSPDLGPASEEKENSFLSTYRTDMMVEHLAREMVKKGALTPDWIPADRGGPDGIGTSR